MPRRIKENGTPEPARLRDPTLSFEVRDSKIEGIGFFCPPLKLHSLREHLSTLTLVSSADPAGFNFPNFVKNIRGLKYVAIGGLELEVLFTRSSAFLIFQGLPGRLASLEDIFGGGPLSRVNLLSSHDGPMTSLCRLTGQELRALLGAASQNASGGFLSGSLLPSDSSTDVDPKEFRERLKQCSVVSADSGFSLDEFANSVSLVSVFHDESDAAYFVIALEKTETVYSLYVNVHAPPANEENPMVARLQLGADSCMLFRADVIG